MPSKQKGKALIPDLADGLRAISFGWLMLEEH